MPAIMTIGGIVLAVLGLLIAIAGMPDRAAGLGLGSDLVQSGSVLLAGGLIIAALGQVLKALRDVADRVEEAGFGLPQPRSALNDTFGEEAPAPLPRAGARNATPAARDDFEQPVPMPSTRETRAPRPAPRSAESPRPQARQEQRLDPRKPSRPDSNFETQQEDEFAEDMSQPAQEPRWMRAQAEANNRQQSAGVIPLQASRQSRATPVVPETPRREPAAAPYEPLQRRRAAVPEPHEAEAAEATVVRSGIIGGMAYTLYSDGSIEAELPAGTVRFGSLTELQEHVKRAGADDQEGYSGTNAAQH
ncbi:MAG: hypothetical protein KF835_03565 [Xanthobacteraceae bacterium]|nr:hypothetical protein [Xanthobacteraceae bacterium]